MDEFPVTSWLVSGPRGSEWIRARLTSAACSAYEQKHRLPEFSGDVFVTGWRD